MKVITITGNKPMELNIRNEKDHRIFFIKEALKQRLLSLIDDGLEWVIVSGQMGVELWAAQVVIDLREDYNIQLGIFPPFLEYESRWPDIYQELFLEIKEQADYYQPLYEETYKAPYQLINKDHWLIDKTEGCLILADEEYPGSAGYMLDKLKKAASESSYSILFITPEDLEEVVRSHQDSIDGYS
ncbi:SLOG family protein [Gracilibacillus caseinilyticus]|uniref:SLOG family protein n=1 Tax=Gracilibacillus caseinilyticus TaxID=2932256 RepID=A0ABY4EUQ6_9BACI|nr:SLOG family protein [Gracilibacillus caseinilyticus]UOQ47613.1 SLOG family protein [Gracilibacillus caseinilyticus]